TDTPTRTHTPTDTVVPSDTPTNTPEPTDTPTETPTDTHTPTVEPPTATIDLPPTATQSGGIDALYTNSTALVPVQIVSDVFASSTVSNSIDDTNPTRLYRYSGTVGEILTISMRSTSGDLDPFLLVIDPKGRELVRNDDESFESLNAMIRGFRLPESGTYIIVASRYGQQFGFSQGDFDLNITQGSTAEPTYGLFSQPIAYGTAVTGTINDNTPGLLYTFRGNEGDTVSIQMVATSGDLDARLLLTDNLGNLLVANDDDLLNLTIDSLIHEYILPKSGYYSVIATRYGGAPNSGEFQLMVTLEEAGTAGATHPIYAVLNLENSRTLRADGQFFSNFSAGDSADEEKNELRTDTLLTFFLPPLPEGASLESATFNLAPCYEAGSG